ncbi:tRNA processing endoribonuclease [Grosmannia clavigera kw1407]|uniref:ribonuclease Z n=1 Tax=Grosmannia clavigera (strain kw1407 / UAMH 11150) TaxID=655863 RepID=F0XQB5_GROCL|nr:tRNA processing endoribonuclease [Grosmannia clavigera kw1407]EFX00153.1 tRNA processing endoribonuclease [Grosmannia clavigera kw1407]
MKRQRTSQQHADSSLAVPSRPVSRHSFHGAVLPAGLFSSRTTVLRAYRYNRSKKCAARFFLFEQSAAAADSSKSSRALERRRPPPRPIASMLNYVQILTAPSADTPGTCLVVHHDNRRYLFGNVAEGTQRAFVQQKVSLSRTEEIFLTGSVSWHTAGGLIGMILSVAEVLSSARAAAAAEEAQKAQRAQRAQQALAQKAAKKKGNPAVAPEKSSGGAAAEVATAATPEPTEARSLSIHGGINLAHLLATARRFVFRKGMPIRAHEVREDGSDVDGMREADWADENMMVWYVPVMAEGGGETEAESEATTGGRKRNHDAVDSDQERDEDQDLDRNTSLADRTMVDAVLKQMFDSDWKLDALVETTLHAVKMPAKLFVKDAKGHLQPYEGPLPGEGAEREPDRPVLVRQPWPAALIQALPRTKPSRQSVSYVVRNHARRGKVDAAAAARLGVAKRDIRRLVAGENVTAVAADGTSQTVTPEMVVGPSVEGAAFAVADLPDRSFIEAFVARPEWQQASGGLLAPVNTMFWILGPGVASDSRLLAFMRSRPAIRHVVAAPDACPNRLALGSAATLQAKHHRIDPDRFPLPQFDNRVPVVEAEADDSDSGSLPYEPARAGWAVRLAPQVVEEDGKVFGNVDFGEALRELDPAVLALADEARGAAVIPGVPGIPHPDTEVISLGTGSAMPSKYRNVSATLVRVPGVGSYLFDCGENTLGSMRRMLGAAGLADMLRDLRMIWISHLHADHHLGTASVIRAWRDATQRRDGTAESRLLVASHVNMLHWLREYAEVEDYGFERLRLAELDSSARYERVCPPVVLSAAETAEFGLQRIDACRVEHCHGALAVVVTWPVRSNANTPNTPNTPAEPLRVAYSGDCRPSADFARIGRHATLLIHESTFDDELAGEAAAKKHSTMGEALAVGRRMAARRVLLTHFSQRYPKIPVFGADGDGDGDPTPDMHVLVAFDHMRVRLCDFQAAAAFLPALQKLYDGEERG